MSHASSWITHWSKISNLFAQVPRGRVHHPQDLRHPQEQRQQALALDQRGRRSRQESSAGEAVFARFEHNIFFHDY